MSRKAIYLLPIGAFAVCAAILLVALRTGERDLPSTLLNAKVRPFDVPTLTNEAQVNEKDRITQEALQAGEVTVVNFWASWCGPCEIEHPQLMRLSKDGDVVLIGIAFKDAPRDAHDFLTNLGDPFDRIGFDANGRAGIEWGISGVPETFVVDGAGTVVFRHVGPIMPRDLDTQLMPAIAAAKLQTKEAAERVAQ